MKIVKFVFAAIVISACGLFLLFWFKIALPWREHEMRVKNAITLFSNYKESDWRDLYNECQPFFIHGEMDSKRWPQRMKRLNPVHLWVDGDVIFMTWTGGFDDDPLYLWVLRRPVRLTEDEPPEPAGIKVLGPESIPVRPYVIKKQ